METKNKSMAASVVILYLPKKIQALFHMHVQQLTHCAIFCMPQTFIILSALTIFSFGPTLLSIGSNEPWYSYEVFPH